MSSILLLLPLMIPGIDLPPEPPCIVNPNAAVAWLVTDQRRHASDTTRPADDPHDLQRITMGLDLTEAAREVLKK